GPAAPPANGSLWRADLADNYAFRDLRAYFPGDLLTVVITEKSQGKKDASTEAKAESSISASVAGVCGVAGRAVQPPRSALPPQYIAADNTVFSSRLADARIDYFGKGVVADKQGVPMAHRLFDWIWPF